MDKTYKPTFSLLTQNVMLVQTEGSTAPYYCTRRWRRWFGDNYVLMFRSGNKSGNSAT